MDVSKFLSKVVGIYLILASAAMFLNMHQFSMNFNALIHDEPLMFVCGFFTLIIGLLMVVSHNIWQLNWRVIITIIGWITLLKGASLIVYPHLIDTLSAMFVQNVKIAYVISGIDLIIGVLLTYLGFNRVSNG